jgi:phosphonate transport system substrate-binding protein
MIQRLEDQSIDIAWLNPVNYLKLQQHLPRLQYIVTYTELNKDLGEVIAFYHSDITSLKDSDIKVRSPGVLNIESQERTGEQYG